MDNQGFENSPLTATLRILFIASPLPCYLNADLIIGLSLIVEYEGLGISNVSANILPKTCLTKCIISSVVMFLKRPVTKNESDSFSPNQNI